MRTISLILPNYNSDKYLEKVIKSFITQGHPQKRLIIVDGMSTDNSHKIIKKYIECCNQIVWIKRPDNGISHAINIGLDYIDEEDIWGYLGADDLLLPGTLSKVASFFEFNIGINGVFFDSYSYFTELGKINYRRCPSNDFSIKSLIKHGTIAGLQNTYFEAKIIKENLFNETARYAMDYEIYLRIQASSSINMLYVPEASTINIQDGNISQQFSQKANEEALSFAVQLNGMTLILFYKYIKHVVNNFFTKKN